MKQCRVGGQGVIEGVMMRSPSLSAIAVRKADGRVIYEKKRFTPLSKKNKFFGWPVVRGVVSFIDSLLSGVQTISDSAKMYDEEAFKSEEPSKFDKFVAKKTGKSAFDVAMVFAVVLSLAIGIALFFILPKVITQLVSASIKSLLVINLIEGFVRVAIFLGYMVAVSLIRDIKRVYMYHGAEHKTIHCFEHEEELTCENIQKYKTQHPRCGTSYLFLVMAVSILLYCLLDWALYAMFGVPAGERLPLYITVPFRLLLLPLVAGVAYELLTFAAKRDNWLTKILRAPGLALQKLTTRQPDDDMVEVAIVALYAALDEKSDEEINELCKRYSKQQQEPQQDSPTEGTQETKPEA